MAKDKTKEKVPEKPQVQKHPGFQRFFSGSPNKTRNVRSA